MKLGTTSSQQRRTSGRSTKDHAKRFGRVCPEPNIDERFSLALTKKCTVPKLSDVHGESLIAAAGSFVVVNSEEYTMESHFQVSTDFTPHRGGELAALVADWDDLSVEIYARRQVHGDAFNECSGAVEIFPLKHVSHVENHVDADACAKTHAFSGFKFTSSQWVAPFWTGWFASRRKDAMNEEVEWDPKKDATMKAFKNAYLESLPCYISRFDLVTCSAESMLALDFISEAEKLMLTTDENGPLDATCDFELLIVQFLPQEGANLRFVCVVFLSNWRLVLSKRMRDDYAEFLKANLWYYDRFDFEDLMFRLGSKVGTLQSMDDLEGAMFLHNSLVRQNLIFFIKRSRYLHVQSLF